MEFSVGFSFIFFPSVTFLSSVDNVESILDKISVITTILENNIFTASLELTNHL